MRIISCGDISWYLVLLLFPPIITCGRLLLLLDLYAKGFNNHPFVLSILVFLGQLIGGCFQIVIDCRDKAKQQKAKNISKRTQQVIGLKTISAFDQLEDKHKVSLPKTNYFIYFSFALIDLGGVVLISAVSFLDSTQLNNIEFQLKAIQLIIVGLLSIKILHYPIMKHQFLSILLLIIGSIFLSLDTFIKVNNTFNLVIQISAIIISYAIFAFKDVYQKFLMESRFISAFVLLLYKGAFGILICVFLFVILYYVPCPSKSLCSGDNIEDILSTLQEIFNDNSLILLLSLYCLDALSYNVFVLIIIKVYNPTLKVVSDLIGSLFWECILLATGKSIWSYFLILHLVGYLLIVSGTFVYNEIIIVFLFGFATDTRIEISRRSKEEIRINQELSDMNSDLFLLSE